MSLALCHISFMSLMFDCGRTTTSHFPVDGLRLDSIFIVQTVMLGKDEAINMYHKYPHLMSSNRNYFLYVPSWSYRSDVRRVYRYICVNGTFVH